MRDRRLAAEGVVRARWAGLALGVLLVGAAGCSRSHPIEVSAVVPRDAIPGADDPSESPDGGRTADAEPDGPAARPSCGDLVCDPSAHESCGSCPEDCACEGEPCGDGRCDELAGESCETCRVDCGRCPECGDHACDADEAASGACPADCGVSDTCGRREPDGARRCEADLGETCETCPLDCGVCPYCRDGECDEEIGEDPYNCAEDCGLPPSCPNGYCEPERGEDCLNCAPDCWRECDDECGDRVCDELVESCRTCPEDCPAVEDPELCPGCGDGRCEEAVGENCRNCPADCGDASCSWCGNEVCEPPFEDAFNCAADCGSVDVLTCQEVLDCTIGCVDSTVSPPSFSFSCIGVCVAGACAHVRALVDAFVGCAIPVLVDTGNVAAIMTACETEAAACLGVSCGPADG